MSIEKVNVSAIVSAINYAGGVAALSSHTEALQEEVRHQLISLFLSRVTRDIDIANLSVRLTSVCP